MNYACALELKAAAAIAQVSQEVVSCHKAISLSTKIAVIDAVEAGTKLKFEVNTEI